MGKKNSEQITENLFIKELIRKVHDELIESQKEREEKKIDSLFTVKDMTIEVNFIAEKSTKVEGGLDFKVVTVGGNTDIKSQQIHKITLNLEVEKIKEEESTPLSNIQIPEYPRDISIIDGRLPIVVRNPARVNTGRYPRSLGVRPRMAGGRFVPKRPKRGNS